MINLNEIKDDLEQLLYKVEGIVETGYKDKNKEVSFKRDANDLLTKYDIEINNIILEHLENKYPEISIISEEASEITKNSEYSFVVDPIDGTRNFVRNIPVFFIGIGLVKNGKTVLSITYNPITKDLFYAIKDKGAFLNGKQIKVSDRSLELSDVNIRTLPDKKLEKQVVSNIIADVHQVKNNMCCHDEIAGIACDRYDGFISKGSSPWDYCHYLLVEEAGGKVTDWNGDGFDISKDDIVISNDIIHDELLKAVK
jgi:myo-inositol-1(or 4)-monophosphatase